MSSAAKQTLHASRFSRAPCFSRATSVLVSKAISRAPSGLGSTAEIEPAENTVKKPDAVRSSPTAFSTAADGGVGEEQRAHIAMSGIRESSVHLNQPGPEFADVLAGNITTFRPVPTQSSSKTNQGEKTISSTIGDDIGAPDVACQTTSGIARAPMLIGPFANSTPSAFSAIGQLCSEHNGNTANASTSQKQSERAHASDARAPHPHVDGGVGDVVAVATPGSGVGGSGLEAAEEGHGGSRIAAMRKRMREGKCDNPGCVLRRVVLCLQFIAVCCSVWRIMYCCGAIVVDGRRA